MPPRPVRTLYRGVEEVVHSLALLQNKSRSPASHSFPVIGIQALGCRGEHAAGFPTGLPQMWNWRRQLVHARIILAQQQTKVFGSLHMLSVHEEDPTTKVWWSLCCLSLRSLCCLCTACLCIARLSAVCLCTLYCLSGRTRLKARHGHRTTIVRKLLYLLKPAIYSMS